MNKKAICIGLLSIFMVGCAQQSYQRECVYEVSRDLTKKWQKSPYWCAPKSYKEIQEQVILQEQMERDRALRQARQAQYQSHNRDKSDYSKIRTVKQVKQLDVQQPTVTSSKTENLSVEFYRSRQELNYSKKDFKKLLALNKPLTLRGCRFARENKNLNVERALKIRQELINAGYAHNVMITTDKSCINKQAVEVI